VPIVLNLPAELEERLRLEAARRGVPPDACARQVLDQHLPPADRRAQAAEMLEQWARAAESMTDREAAENAAVLRAVDDDRLSDRKLFTAILDDPG
jgi:plasmid stability protein